jgi:hypothetical protein
LAWASIEVPACCRICKLGDVHHLGGHVNVADAALGRGHVLLEGGEAGQRVLEPVLDRGELAAGIDDALDGRVDRRQRGRGAPLNMLEPILKPEPAPNGC